MTRASVRELKEEAPSLVRRAARGERIVITRYGRPQALLGPLEQSAPTPRMRDWLREREAFMRMLPELERRHRGKYVAVHRGRVLGSSPDARALFSRTWKKLRGRTFFVGLVAAPLPVVDMPGFEIVEDAQ